MRCPICGDETGLEIGGEAYCVFCESQKPRRLYPLTLDREPGVFSDWREAVKVLSIPVLVGLLFLAAVYELVKW